MARNNSLVVCMVNAADIIKWCYRYQDLQIHVQIAPGYFPYVYGTPAPAGQGLDTLRGWVEGTGKIYGFLDSILKSPSFDRSPAVFILINNGHLNTC